MRYSIGAGPVRVYGGKKHSPMPYGLAMTLAGICLLWAVIGGIWAAIAYSAESGLATFVVGLVLFFVFAAKGGNRTNR